MDMNIQTADENNRTCIQFNTAYGSCTNEIFGGHLSGVKDWNWAIQSVVRKSDLGSPCMVFEHNLNVTPLREILGKFRLPTLWKQFGGRLVLFQDDC